MLDNMLPKNEINVKKSLQYPESDGNVMVLLPCGLKKSVASLPPTIFPWKNDPGVFDRFSRLLNDLPSTPLRNT